MVNVVEPKKQRREKYTVGMQKLIGLKPRFKEKVKAVVAEMEIRGWNIRIVWGERTKEENEVLVKKVLPAEQVSIYLAKSSI